MARHSGQKRLRTLLETETLSLVTGAESSVAWTPQTFPQVMGKGDGRCPSFSVIESFHLASTGESLRRFLSSSEARLSPAGPRRLHSAHLTRLLSTASHSGGQ